MIAEPRDRKNAFTPAQPGSAAERSGLVWPARLVWLAIVIERLLPALLPVAGIGAVFFILAWSGAFLALEPWGRAGLAGLLAFGLLYSARHLLAFRLPDGREIDRRLDASRPDLHRPLATLADRPAANDPVAQALWREHRARAEQASRALQAESGDARLREKDRFALRAGLLAAVIAAAFVAGDEKATRLSLAFDWTTPKTPPVPPRLDAWIDPPAYTGRPPIFLSGAAANEAIRAPVGSTVTIRLTAARVEGQQTALPSLSLVHGSGLEVPKVEAGADAAKPTPSPGVAIERRILKADGELRVVQGDRDLAVWRLGVIPDLAPKVVLKEAKIESASPERQSRAGLRLIYSIEDDYGLAKADVIIERVTGTPGARTLFPPPATTLPLRVGDGSVLIETEDHAWAGSDVRLRIRVEDDLGQNAESETLTASLPQRPFTQALAKALVEQRRNLNFSPDDRSRVRLAFEALLFEPERYSAPIADFIALDMIRTALRNARKDERLREISDEMHDLAVAIENGDMTDAERRLREAEARLREAIERGATPEEIKRLAEELRRAMDQFLREFAERALQDRDRNTQERPQISPDRMLSQRDLQDMLRKIEEMARSGNTAEAQRLLNELRQILENLRSARRQDVDPRMRELGKQIEELDRLQREQRDLRDRTFRDSQQGNPRNQRRPQQGQQGQQGQRQQGQRGQQRGQQGQDGDEGEPSLEEQQQALRERLRQLRERLKQNGMQEGEGFGDADQGMEDAEGQLGQGKPGDATQGQQRALDGLGRAADGMARELQRQMGEGEGEGEGPGMGRPDGQPRNRADGRPDPLGRNQPNMRRDFEDHSRGLEDYGRAEGTISERAERVLRELRRRLGEFERPREELDYLERLLRQR